MDQTLNSQNIKNQGIPHNCPSLLDIGIKSSQYTYIWVCCSDIHADTSSLLIYLNETILYQSQETAAIQYFSRIMPACRALPCIDMAWHRSFYPFHSGLMTREILRLSWYNWNNPELMTTQYQSWRLHLWFWITFYIQLCRNKRDLVKYLSNTSGNIIMKPKALQLNQIETRK